MTRSGRMKPVQQVVGANERREAKQLAATEEKLATLERKLDELKQYEEDYRKGFNARAAAGIGGHGLRDYQLFLARLGEAIRQQHRIVMAARAERDAQQQHWREAARHHKAIEHVVENWQAEERRHVERRDQRDSDERAQRKTHRRID
jgi:flagellar FliJ protein